MNYISYEYSNTFEYSYNFETNIYSCKILIWINSDIHYSFLLKFSWMSHSASDIHSVDPWYEYSGVLMGMLTRQRRIAKSSETSWEGETHTSGWNLQNQLIVYHQNIIVYHQNMIEYYQNIIVYHQNITTRSGDLLYANEIGWMYFMDRMGDTFRWWSNINLNIFVIIIIVIITSSGGEGRMCP